jgi:hypothetical protein
MATGMTVKAQVLLVPTSIDGLLVDLCVLLGVADPRHARGEEERNDVLALRA